MASSSNNPLNNFEENTEDIGRRLSDAFFGPSNPYPHNPIPPTYPQNPIPPTYPQNPIPPTYQQIPNYQPNPNYQQNPTNLNFHSPYFQQTPQFHEFNFFSQPSPRPNFSSGAAGSSTTIDGTSTASEEIRVDVQGAPSTSRKRKKARDARFNAWFWKYFEQTFDENDNLIRIRCKVNNCKADYDYVSSNGTNTYSRHADKHVKKNEEPQERPDPLPVQTTINPDDTRNMVKYDANKMLERAHGAAAEILHRFSTAAVMEDPIVPPVQVNYTELLINGQFVNAASGKTFPTLDPRTGEVIAHVAEGDSEDINRAVHAARKAFDEGPWPKMTAYERSCILLRFADLIDKHNDELAALETWDNGKPYEQAAKIEVPMVSRIMRYYAGWADKIHGLIVPADGPHHVQVLHEPIGVAGQIIPWNFPLLMFAWKVGPALACGNTIVLKTAEHTPLTALYAAKLLHEAGLPDGVLNVVSGFGPTAGAALASHMDVDKIAFTGSTGTGKIIRELAARSNLKPVTLELGGKSPFIVMDDANVDHAVELAHFALFYNQGQCCCAGSRTFVHENVYDEFVEKSKARALKRVVGDPFKKGVEQGPQIDGEQFNKILRYIKSGIDSGANLVTGGDRSGSKGFYIQPTIFSDVEDNMTIAQEEIFGPVQSILKFKDLNEVIQRANASRYGLAAGVFTNNLNTANTLMRTLRVGTVWINCFYIFDVTIPFGGYKMSGVGREKGIDSLKNYLQVKAVVTPLRSSAWL